MSENEGKIIMETRMHCEDCQRKVSRAIFGYPGVEDFNINLKENRVTVKAPKVDAKKLFKTVKKESGGKITKLIYPDVEDIKKKEEEKKFVEVTLAMKASMHCSSCRRKIEKAAQKIKDVQSVKVEGENLIVKGWNLDSKKVCEKILEKSGKHAEVVPLKDKDEDPQIVAQYVFAPQYFSDENPNACTLM